MLKSLIQALVVVVGLALSGFSCAVSLGGINVTTALGEPLKAKIALETGSNAEANSLSARLASPDAFKNSGVDYPYGLPLLTFEIKTNPATGVTQIEITSAQPVNEPYVNLLVELNWPSGKLLREYTFLLDPPGYAVEQPKAAELLQVEPVVVMSPPEFQPQGNDVKTEPDVASETETISAAKKEEKKEFAEPAPEPEEAVKPSKTDKDAYVATGAIKVKRGDTLHKLASQAKSPDISLERMLVALYRANADAFDGKNMNRLKTGKILQMPDQAELDNLGQADAAKEIRVQAADWHAYRQKLAAASKQVTDLAPKQEVSGKIGAQVKDKTPAAKEPAKEVVRLSKGESPAGKGAVGGGAKNAQDKMDETIAAKKVLQESSERVAMLEKNIKAMQRLAELKGQMADEQARPGAKEGNAKEKSSKLGALPQVQTPQAMVASDVTASSAVSPVKSMPTPKVVAQPSILDDMLGQPLYLAGLAAALLGMLGLGFMRRRRGSAVTRNTDLSNNAKTEHAGNAKGRLAHLFSLALGLMKRGSKRSKNQEVEEVEDIGAISGRITTPVAPSPETGDFTKTLVSSTVISHAPTDEVDPISEADLFLNFGRDEQAEEILKDALTKNPTNHLIHLKLLSIYANRKDTNSFSTIARQLKDSGDAAAWEQAASMGLKLEANNPMYSRDSGTTAPTSTQQTPAPDQIASSDTIVDVGKIKEQELVMDFDLGMATTEMTVAASAQPPTPSETVQEAQEKTIALTAPMDFDITGSHSNITSAEEENVEASEVQLNDLIFDVTGSHTAAQAEDKKKEPADESISYLLDFPASVSAPEAPQTTTSAALDMGLGKISLNLDDPIIPPAVVTPPVTPKNEEAHDGDIATKLDLAKAYQEMGDSNGAREILEEVVRDGNEQQRAAAEALLQLLPA